MRTAAVEASTEPSTVEGAAPANAAAEARLAAQGVSSRHAPVVQTTERARTGAGLAAWRRESAPRRRLDGRHPAATAAVESASTVQATRTEPAAVEPAALNPAAVKPAALNRAMEPAALKPAARRLMEPARATEAETPAIEDVAIHEGSAVGDEDVVVEDDGVAMPVASPVVPPPAEAAKEPDVEAHAERDARSGDEEPRIPVPSRPGDDGSSVHHPRIVLRYVDDLRTRRFDDDRLSLLGHLRLQRRLQVACRLRASAHVLDGAHHVRLVLDVGVADG